MGYTSTLICQCVPEVSIYYRYCCVDYLVSYYGGRPPASPYLSLFLRLSRPLDNLYTAISRCSGLGIPGYMRLRLLCSCVLLRGCCGWLVPDLGGASFEDILLGWMIPGEAGLNRVRWSIISMNVSMMRCFCVPNRGCHSAAGYRKGWLGCCNACLYRQVSSSCQLLSCASLDGQQECCAELYQVGPAVQVMKG